MNYIGIILALLLPSLLASLAPAQTGDWQAVRNLQAGTNISVLSRSHLRNLCVFEQATEKQLFCEHTLYGQRGTFGPAERVYERMFVREVRLEHSETANIATGAAIGGGMGAAIGASAGNGNLTRGGGALVLGTGGAIIGGFFGRDFPVLPRQGRLSAITALKNVVTVPIY